MGESLNDPNIVAQIEYGLSAEEVGAVNQSQRTTLTTNEIAALKQSKGILSEIKKKQLSMSIDEGSESGNGNSDRHGKKDKNDDVFTSSDV